MWVVQELTVGKRIVFYCGSDEVDGQSFNDAQRLFRRLDRGDGFDHGVILFQVLGANYDASQLFLGNGEREEYFSGSQFSNPKT